MASAALLRGDDDDDDSDDDDGDDDDDEELHEVMKLGAELRKMDGDEDEEAPAGGSDIVPRTKNELVEEHLKDEETIEIAPGDEVIEIGIVCSVIASEGTIVVKAMSTSSPLVEGSILCLQDKFPLGRIYEVFGPVTAPFYVVKRRQEQYTQPLMTQRVFAVLKSISYITPT